MTESKLVGVLRDLVNMPEHDQDDVHRLRHKAAVALREWEVESGFKTWKELRVGDEVRVIGYSMKPNPFDGYTGIISRIEPTLPFPYYVDHLNGDFMEAFSEEQLEKIDADKIA